MRALRTIRSPAGRIIGWCCSRCGWVFAPRESVAAKQEKAGRAVAKAGFDFHDCDDWAAVKPKAPTRRQARKPATRVKRS